MIKLSPRMMMAADMVRRGHVLCDVGTDHAYLPSYLIINGLCPSALACDIGRGPLDNARKTVESLGLEEKIALRLSDGLDEVRPEEADDFVFCGMGGTLMAELLGRAEWLKNEDKRIIAQPMTHAEDVRRFFVENGFEIAEEKTCRDSGHIYVAMSAVYTGKSVTYPVSYIYCGRLPENPCAENAEFIEKQLSRLKNHFKGIEGNDALTDERDELAEIINAIEEELEKCRR